MEGEVGAVVECVAIVEDDKCVSACQQRGKTTKRQTKDKIKDASLARDESEEEVARDQCSYSVPITLVGLDYPAFVVLYIFVVNHDFCSPQSAFNIVVFFI